MIPTLLTIIVLLVAAVVFLYLKQLQLKRHIAALTYYDAEAARIRLQKFAFIGLGAVLLPFILNRKGGPNV